MSGWLLGLLVITFVSVSFAAWNSNRQRDRASEILSRGEKKGNAGEEN